MNVMKYKIRVEVPVKKKTLFGSRTVYEERTIEVDRETYTKWKKEQEEKEEEQFFEDMILYDTIFDDD